MGTQKGTRKYNKDAFIVIKNLDVVNRSLNPNPELKPHHEPDSTNDPQYFTETSSESMTDTITDSNSMRETTLLNLKITNNSGLLV